MHILVYIYITTMFTFWWLPCSPSYPFPPPSWPPGTVPGVPTAARPRPPCRCAARLRRPQRCRATGDATDLLMFRWKIIWNLVGGWGNIYICVIETCCQRWNHQLFVYIHFRIYYMILCFLLSMRKPLLLEIQTGLLWARKRQFVSLNTLHYLKPYWPFAVHTQAFSSGNRA